MTRTALPFGNGFYQAGSLVQSNQTAINCYRQDTEAGGLSEYTLFGLPGINQLATTGPVQETNRGSHVKGGIAYFVNGDTLYSLNRTIVGTEEDFDTTALGTIEGEGRVFMANNETQLFVLVPGGKGYIYNEDAGTPFQEITDADFTANGNPETVVYLDGYFVLSTDEKKIIVSALQDGLAYDALDFGSAETDPDAIVSMVVLNNQLFVGGSETFEAFQNIGGTGFPFQRIPGQVMPVGVLARFSLVEHDNQFVFIGAGENDSAQVYISQGQQSQVISNSAIDRLLLTATPEQIEDGFAFTYSQAGADFVCFTVGTRSFSYQFNNGTWQERESFINLNGNITREQWRVASLVTAYNRLLVGDRVDGRIGELDLDLYSEYGENIIREFSTMPFSNQQMSFSVPSIELTMEAGVGNSTVRDPVVTMTRSKDGKTFSYERSRKLGKAGDYGRRTIWNKNGRAARFEVFKFTMSDRCKFAVIALHGDIEANTI